MRHRMGAASTEQVGWGMHVGWIDAYVYAADLYCEDCGRAIQGELDAAGHEDGGDSEDYPQGPYPDGGGEADGPHHCGSNEGCVNAMTIEGVTIGVWLGNPLTREGVRYLEEMIDAPNPSAYQQALHDFWRRVYADYLGPEKEEEEEELELAPEPPYVDPNQLPLPGVTEASTHDEVVRYEKYVIAALRRFGMSPQAASALVAAHHADKEPTLYHAWARGLNPDHYAHTIWQAAGKPTQYGSVEERQLPGIREKAPPLTAEQLGALERFAARNGRHWKERLREMWFHGAPIRTDDDTILYSLRNTHGPSWLVRFRLSGSVHEANRPEPVDDPFYVIQGLYLGGTIASVEFGYDDEAVAIDEARELLRSLHFEGDYVRVITRDGELVWDSRRERTTAEEHPATIQILTWKGEHRGEKVPAKVGMEVRISRGGHDPYVITRLDPENHRVAIKPAAWAGHENWIDADSVVAWVAHGEHVDPYTWAEEAQGGRTTKTRLDLILDWVETNKTETTIDTDGYTREQVERIIETAKARGLRASYDGRFVLIQTPLRQLREAAVHLQRGERIRVRSKGPGGQPFEAFWYTVPDTMTPEEVALHFAQTGQPGMFIEIDGGRGLKWTFRQSTHAGLPAVTRVPHAPRRH